MIACFRKVPVTGVSRKQETIKQEEKTNQYVGKLLMSHEMTKGGKVERGQ